MSILGTWAQAEKYLFELHAPGADLWFGRPLDIPFVRGVCELEVAVDEAALL